MTLMGVQADANEDEGFKIDELGEGNLVARVYASTINESLSQQGVELTEEDEGDLDAKFVDSFVNGNDDEGLAAEQVAPGVGTLTLIRSDFTGNGDPSTDLTDVTLVNIDSLVD